MGGDGTQVVEQRNHHDDGYGEMIVVGDEAPRGTPDPAAAAGGKRVEATLEAIEADRKRVHPDEQFDVPALVQGHQCNGRHQLYLEHLVELMPRVPRIECESGRDAHPEDKQKQHDDRRRPGHPQLVAGNEQRQEDDPGSRRCEGSILGKAEGQAVRIHDAQPGPQQDANPRMAQGNGQHGEKDPDQQQVTHGQRPHRSQEP
ncbi:MAG: hypothetical protein FAZ92_03778 [Accumulibacter sp.]|nr:MAG: hypothetical protein FAZ92_03778 [Accumulibacter sp.]